MPDDFAEFKRLTPPLGLGPYEKHESNYTMMSNGIVADHWVVVPMTEEEKEFFIKEAKSNWEQNGFASWTFNEELCQFEPPVPIPSEEERYKYRWNEDELNWEKVE